MTQLRALVADDWPVWRALRLAALADAPHAFGSPLAAWQGDGDTERRWRARLEAVAVNIVADLDGRPAGMVSGDRAGLDTVELISLWVAPTARGRGVGDLLVAAVVEWAEQAGAEKAVLRVYESNHHAVLLYRRSGFTRTSVAAAVPGDDRPEWVMQRPLAARRIPPGDQEGGPVAAQRFD
ncbi:GNAT family N-acetyltransferase [Frankia sp. AiPs1]|uniref:GNAT family N-acetyltransferase n=1 Tax=Frankia sp. AiPs1 TaxID=573493 RepID=UPI002043B5B9|nr:GNAT family N-acetyltransferase [Frankia sp. AiPs1]MCM3921990.1 GNAT family N-acetyltransferase [Frankia sp. AiPs1]